MKKILFVDDEGIFATPYVQTLRATFDVAYAKDAGDVPSRVNIDESLRLIVLDVMMPTNTFFDRAILIVDENDNQNLPLSSLVAEKFGRAGLKTTTSLFRPAFVKDGLFREAFSTQADALKKLPIKDKVRTICFGRQAVNYTRNSELNGLITATMKLELNALSSDGLQSVFAESVEGIGAGFSENQARKNAEEKIVSRLNDGILAKIHSAFR